MAGYTRQSTFADGDTITAALFNNEYNQLVNAFSNTTGHSHDGTAASGPVIGLIGDAGETSPNNKVLIDTTNNYIEFYVEVSSAPVQQLYIADGAIIPVTDSDVDLGTSSLYFKDTYTDTVTTTGNVSIGGNLTVTGNATISGNLTFGDADTDSINLSAEIDSNIVPNTDDTYDLGTSTKQWRNLYIDGTAEIDTLALDGTTVTSTAAELNILDGVTSTATELNILDGVTATTTEINLLDGVTSTTAELNILDGVTSTATELNIVDGDTAATSTTLADADRVVVNDNGTMVQVALTDFETYFEGALDTLSNVTTVGALNAGSITSGFGAIDNGSSAITTTGTVTYGSLSDGSITITAFVDEDDMTSNSATLVPTQQSVKAYVDSQVTAQDLDFAGDTGGALSIDLDSESLTIAGGTGIDTSGATNTLTVAIDSTVTTLTGTQTLTNKTLTSPVISSISNTGTLTLPTSTDTLVGRATTDTLTNKTISGSSNTLSNIANSSLTNSTVSYGGVSVALGASDATPAFDLSDATAYPGDSSLVTTGALNSGSITSGFGSIDVGSSAITTTGTVTGGTLAGTLSTAAQTNITSVGTLSSATISGDLTVDTSTLKVDSTNNRVGILNATPDVTLDIGSATDAVHLPVGTTAQRPASPAAGYFRYNSTTGKFEGYTDDWGQIGGGSGTNMDTNIYAGDGSTVNFTLSTAPDTEQNLMVFIDGVFQAHDSYSVSGTTLTFSTAPASGRVITAYHSTTTVGGSNYSIATMTGDGSDTTLTLSTAPVHENNVQVYFDGVYQSKSNYSISGTTVTFTTAPPSGVTVEAITATNTSITTATQLVDADSDTMIQVEESSDEDKIRFDTGGTERMIIDSNGVGIGNAVASSMDGGANNLVVGTGSGTEGMTIYSGTANSGVIYFADGASGDDRFRGQIGYSHSDNAFSFRTNASASANMTIDSSGNLLVGKTSSAFGTAGVQASAVNGTWSTRANNPPLALNRLSTEGDIIDFYKDSTKIGSISIAGTDDIALYSSATNHTGLRLGQAYYIPTNNAGSPSDATVDIGLSSFRYKDLYLSGSVKVDAGQGILFGGAAGASGMTSQVLDDYEEGTWTPACGATLSTAVGKYTKIGNQVTVHYHIVSTGSLPSSTGQVIITGLPFTSVSGSLSAAPIYARYYTPNDSTLTSLVQDSEAQIRLININETNFDYTIWGELEATANNSIYIIGTATYQV